MGSFSPSCQGTFGAQVAHLMRFGLFPRTELRPDSPSEWYLSGEDEIERPFLDGLRAEGFSAGYPDRPARAAGANVRSYQWSRR